MLATEMCTKAVRRGKLIGVVRGDEFTIALSDVPWIYKKVHFLAGPTLKRLLDKLHHGAPSPAPHRP